MKGKYILISAIITVVLFFMLGYVQNKALDNKQIEVLVVKQNVKIGRLEKLDKSMLELKRVPSLVATDAVVDENDITSKYALVDLESGEVLRKSKIGDINDAQIINVDPNMRKLAIPVNGLSDAIAGQVRKDTLVDILFTNSPTSKEPNIQTETVLQKVRVLGVTDSNGVLIENSNSIQVAAVILSVTPEQAHMLINKESKGKFTLVGVAKEGKPYDDIVVK